MTFFKSLLAAAALAAFAMPALAKTPTGSPAPDFNVVDTYGNAHSLSALRGKNVILEWTNDQCPYVKKHYGADNMQQTQKQLAGEDTVWVTVISSAPGKQGYVDAAAANALTTSRNAAPSAVVLDPSGDLGRAYDAKTTPHMYIIDPEGTLVYQGAIDSNRSASASTIPGAANYVKAAMADLDAGRDVVINDTQAYGCPIKY